MTTVVDRLKDALDSHSIDSPLNDVASIPIEPSLIRHAIDALNKTQADLQEANDLLSMKPTLAKKLNDRIKALVQEVEVLRGDTKVHELERKVQRLEGELRQSYATKNFTLRSGLMEIEKVFLDSIDGSEEVGEIWGEIMLLLADDNRPLDHPNPTQTIPSHPNPANSGHAESQEPFAYTNRTGSGSLSGGGTTNTTTQGFPPTSALKTHPSTVASRRLARKALLIPHPSPFPLSHPSIEGGDPSALTPPPSVQGQVGRFEEAGWVACPPTFPPQPFPGMSLDQEGGVGGSTRETLSPPDASYHQPGAQRHETGNNWLAVDGIKANYESSTTTSSYKPSEGNAFDILLSSSVPSASHPPLSSTSQPPLASTSQLPLTSSSAPRSDTGHNPLPSSPAPRYRIPDASAMDFDQSSEVMRACVLSLRLLFSSLSSPLISPPQVSNSGKGAINSSNHIDASHQPWSERVEGLSLSVDSLVEAFGLLLEARRSPRDASDGARTSSLSSSHDCQVDASSFVALAEQVLGSIRGLRDLYEQQQLLAENNPVAPAPSSSFPSLPLSINNQGDDFEVHAEALSSSVLNALRSLSLMSQKRDRPFSLGPTPSPSKALLNPNRLIASSTPPLPPTPDVPLLPTYSHPGAVLSLFSAFASQPNASSDSHDDKLVGLFRKFLKSPGAATLIAGGGEKRGDVGIGHGMKGGEGSRQQGVTGHVEVIEADGSKPRLHGQRAQQVEGSEGSKPQALGEIKSSRSLRVEIQILSTLETRECLDDDGSGGGLIRLRLTEIKEVPLVGSSDPPEPLVGDRGGNSQEIQTMLSELRGVNINLAYRLSRQDHEIASLRVENDQITRMLVDLKVENAEKENECMRLQQRLKKSLRFENQIRDENEERERREFRLNPKT